MLPPFLAACLDNIINTNTDFAQMEMRTILAHLFRHYDVELAEPTKSFDPATYQGVNRRTMGPQDLGSPEETRADGSKRVRLGMHIHVHERQR